MKKIKKIISVIICGVLIFSTLTAFGCDNRDVLKVYNCYDYIDEELIEEFEKYYEEKTGKAIRVQYSCFDTPEDAYNKLKINNNCCDVLCPSEYMIQKMAREDMLQKFTLYPDGNYNTNVSPYVQNVFKSISWDGGDLSEYAAGYMWGTLGLVYNPEKVDEADMTTWASLWESKYNKKFTIKDSVRDTFFIGLAKQFQSELNTAKIQFQMDNDLDAYQTKLKGYFNNTEASTVNSVKTILIDLAKNCRNLEVDDGKEDVIKGDVSIYFAWSGDAVYSMDVADERNVELRYSVPDEGSNCWFDGWCIPKSSTKVEEAKEFIEFLSAPENAIKNMDYIGYVSVIAGQEVFDRIIENYEDEESEEEIDLGYFFGEGDYSVKCSETNRQFYTQYPPEEVVNRCVIMSYFTPTVNNLINDMWIAVKSNII